MAPQIQTFYEQILQSASNHAIETHNLDMEVTDLQTALYTALSMMTPAQVHTMQVQLGNELELWLPEEESLQMVGGAA